MISKRFSSREKHIAGRQDCVIIPRMGKTVLIFGLAAGMALGGVKVEVAGLQVTAKGYVPEGENDFRALRAFSWQAGTRVGLLVTSSDKTIVGLDEEKSKVTGFTDDQETDFTKAKGRFGKNGAEFGMMSESEDGRAIVTHVESPGLPGKGAKTLTLKGDLVVSLASKSMEVKSEVAVLEKGKKLVVGGNSFEIDSVGKPDWGDDPLQINLKSSVNHKDFKGFHFYDTEGIEIESKRSSSGSMGIFGKRTYTVSFNLKKKVDKIVLAVDAWSDLEVVKVPFDFKIGAGL